MIRAYEPGDYDYVSKYQPIGNFEDLLNDGSHVRTIEHDDTVLSVAGVSVMWDGVGQLWSMQTKYAPDHSMTVVRDTRELIAQAFTQLELHRVQTTVRADDPHLQKWIRLVGLSVEGVLTAAASDRTDLLMYMKLRGD